MRWSGWTCPATSEWAARQGGREGGAVCTAVPSTGMCVHRPGRGAAGALRFMPAPDSAALHCWGGGCSAEPAQGRVQCHTLTFVARPQHLRHAAAQLRPAAVLPQAAAVQRPGLSAAFCCVPARRSSGRRLLPQRCRAPSLTGSQPRPLARPLALLWPALFHIMPNQQHASYVPPPLRLAAGLLAERDAAELAAAGVMGLTDHAQPGGECFCW